MAEFQQRWQVPGRWRDRWPQWLLLTAVLAPLAGLGTVLLVDCATFAFAAACLLGVAVPTPQPQPHGSLLADMRVGWRYLSERPGLLRLLAQFAWSEPPE